MCFLQLLNFVTRAKASQRLQCCEIVALVYFVAALKLTRAHAWHIVEFERLLLILRET